MGLKVKASSSKFWMGLVEMSLRQAHLDCKKFSVWEDISMRAAHLSRITQLMWLIPRLGRLTWLQLI
jgi:hypothetical protein